QPADRRRGSGAASGRAGATGGFASARASLRRRLLQRRWARAGDGACLCRPATRGVGRAAGAAAAAHLDQRRRIGGGTGTGGGGGWALGRVEQLRWPAAGGLTISGLLIYPAAYEPGQRYPLVLLIHGGPDWYWGEYFPTGWAQLLSSNGYAVLLPNPRGGTG